MSVPSYVKLSPQMDMATLVNALNTNFNQVQSQDRRKVITDEDGNDRIVLGKQEDGTYAIRVAGTGKDVDTASQSDLVMSSDWKMWKIIHSGNAYMNPTSIRRSGTVSLTSTNIGYTSDIFIYIEGLAELLGYTQGFTGQLQLFVRENSNKKDISDAGLFYFDGTNWAIYNHSYFVNSQGYLVIRTDIRWMAGTVTFTPRSNGLPVTTAYWEIANPTRAVPGGQGGGGSPSGKFVYYDSVILNGSSASITKSDWNNGYAQVTVAPGAFSSIYSYTYQFFDNATSWFYPKDAPVPQILPLV